MKFLLALATIFLSMEMTATPGHSQIALSDGRTKVVDVVAMIVDHESCDFGVLVSADVADIQVRNFSPSKNSSSRALLKELAQAMSLQLTEIDREEKFVWFQLDKKLKGKE